MRIPGRALLVLEPGNGERMPKYVFALGSPISKISDPVKLDVVSSEHPAFE